MGQLIFWISIMILMIVLEVCTVQIVSIWFAIGALAALISSFFLPFEIQLIVFVLVSILFLIFTRPLLRKMTKSIVATNIDSQIGCNALVIEDIEQRNNKGRVKLNGVDWNARCESGEEIKAGEIVKVKEISGTTLIIEKNTLDNKSDDDLWGKYNNYEKEK